MKNTKDKTMPRKADLPETEKDKKSLVQDETTIDLPDVRDIPGQEHIRVPALDGLTDTTISSDDEEGISVFEDEDEDKVTGFPDSNVSKEEKQALKDASEKMPDLKDENNLEDAQLDDSDEDGELLNERTNVSGSDLDVPGSEEDDANEDIGEEDEENNSYSLNSEKEDDSISKQ